MKQQTFSELGELATFSGPGNLAKRFTLSQSTKARTLVDVKNTTLGEIHIPVREILPQRGNCYGDSGNLAKTTELLVQAKLPKLVTTPQLPTIPRVVLLTIYTHVSFGLGVDFVPHLALGVAQLLPTIQTWNVDKIRYLFSFEQVTKWLTFLNAVSENSLTQTIIRFSENGKTYNHPAMGGCGLLRHLVLGLTEHCRPGHERVDDNYSILDSNSKARVLHNSTSFGKVAEICKLPHDTKTLMNFLSELSNFPGLYSGAYIGQGSAKTAGGERSI